MSTIIIEDIAIQLPQTESAGGKTNYERNITRGGYPKITQKGYTYTIPYVHNSNLELFEELCSNPAFSCVPIYDLSSRINTGAITGFSKKWGINLSNLSFNILQGYSKFMFNWDTIKKPLHSRWLSLVKEDFDTDAIWVADTSITGTWNSYGYQTTSTHQDIPWENLAGTWEPDTAFSDILLASQVLLHSDDTAGYIVAGWEWWSDYMVESWVQRADSVNDDAGLCFRTVDKDNTYIFLFGSSTNVYLYEETAGSITELANADYTSTVDEWYHLKVEAVGHRIKCYVNNSLVIDIYDDTYTSGRAGLYAALNNTYFDDFRVTLLPATTFNMPPNVIWTNQYYPSLVTSAYGTERKVVAPEDVQFKLDVSVETTPSTVFLYDYDNPTYTRVYNTTHEFSAVPVFDNGQIRVVLTGSPIEPNIYAYINSSWELIGTINPQHNINGEGDINTWDSVEYFVEKLTDQYCKVLLRFYKTSDVNIPLGTFFDMRLWIRGGLPAVLVELDDQYWHQSDEAGIYFNSDLTTDFRFFYAPKENLYDAVVESSAIGLNPTEIDDNWQILFQDDTDASTLDFILGFFGDEARDNLGSEDHVEATETSDRWDTLTRLGSKFAGIFFAPYDINSIFREADSDYADVTTNGTNDVGTIPNYTGDGAIRCYDVVGSQYAQWNVGILPKGNYMSIARVGANIGTPIGVMNVDNDADYDGDLATKTISIAVTNVWQYEFLPFYTNGTNDVYLSIESSTFTEMQVDNWLCIPMSNAVDYLSDISHQAFADINLIRGLKK